MNHAHAFDSITQLLIEQKQVMERLEQENRDLRHQLADLKRGVGITVTVDGSPLHVSPPLSHEATAPHVKVEAKRGITETPQARPGLDRVTDEQPTIDWNISTSSPLAESFVL